MSESEVLFCISREDVEAYAGRAITDDEAHTVRKTLEFQTDDLWDAIATVVGNAEDKDDDEDDFEEHVADALAIVNRDKIKPVAEEADHE